MSSSHKHHYKYDISDNIFFRLWKSFWENPHEKCPKCGSLNVEYYDPFLFAPLRTLNGKRRFKCVGCSFIWRPQRSYGLIWDKILPRQ